MQVDPIKPALKAPGTKRLKLTYGMELISKVAFKFKLRRYNQVLLTTNDQGLRFVKIRVRSCRTPQVTPFTVWGLGFRV